MTNLRRRTYGMTKDKANRISLNTMEAYIRKYNKKGERNARV